MSECQEPMGDFMWRTFDQTESHFTQADLRSAPATCKIDPHSYSDMDLNVSTFHACCPSTVEGFYFCLIFQMFKHESNTF